jgi:hypothetical protein
MYLNEHILTHVYTCSIYTGDLGLPPQGDFGLPPSPAGQEDRNSPAKEKKANYFGDDFKNPNIINMNKSNQNLNKSFENLYTDNRNSDIYYNERNDNEKIGINWNSVHGYFNTGIYICLMYIFMYLCIIMYINGTLTINFVYVH